MYAEVLVLLLSFPGMYSCPNGVIVDDSSYHHLLQYPPNVTITDHNSATAYGTITDSEVLYGRNVSLHIEESSGKCFNCSITPARSGRFICSGLPLHGDFQYAYFTWSDQRISKQPFSFSTNADKSRSESFNNNLSHNGVHLAVGITSGVLLIVLCFIAVFLVSALILRKKKENLKPVSCETIRSHRAHTMQMKEQEQMKQKKLKKQWSDRNISPPIPPRTEDMLIFDPVNGLFVSTEITIIADVHSSESDDSILQGGSETPEHFSSCRISSKNIHITDSPISSRQSSEGSTTCLLSNRPSYENTSLQPVTDQDNPPHDSSAPKVTHPQSYENILQNDSPLLNSNTPPPPPTPPHPHSTKHHTFYIASTSTHHHDDDDHEQSRSLHDTEYNDKVNVDEFLGRPQRSDNSDEEDDTSQESLDMWPPPIPRRTEEMYVMKDSAESGNHLDYDEQIDMKQNVAYETFMRSNIYV